MSNKWQDYTLRVRVGDGKRAHLAEKGNYFTACDLSDWDNFRPAPDDWPLCKACARAIEAAKRRAQA